MIAQQDIKELRRLPIHTYNVNYLSEDTDIQFDKKISPLLSACYVGKIEIVMMVLDNEELDIDMESYPESYTPLMVACFKGFYEIVKLLLDRKASVNKINRLGQKPILFCFSRLEETFYKYENKKICMMLLELLLVKGADINIRIDEKQGYTVLMKLASTEFNSREKLNNNIDIIKFLMERGADSTIAGYNNKSVYDVINSNIDKSFREELVRVFQNTKQTIFYEKETGNNIIMEACSINSSPIRKANGRRTLNENTCIVLEPNETRMNCCIICKLENRFY